MAREFQELGMNSDRHEKQATNLAKPGPDAGRMEQMAARETTQVISQFTAAQTHGTTQLLICNHGNKDRSNQ